MASFYAAILYLGTMHCKLHYSKNIHDFSHVEVKIFFFSYWFRNQNFCINTSEDFLSWQCRMNTSCTWKQCKQPQHAGKSGFAAQNDLPVIHISVFFSNDKCKFLKLLAINLCVDLAL